MGRPGVSVTGEIIRGKTVRLGYLHQGDAGRSHLTRGRRSRRARHARSRGRRAASQARPPGLRGDTQRTPAGELSGGERRARSGSGSWWTKPVPSSMSTNDLDVDTSPSRGPAGRVARIPGAGRDDRYFLERVPTTWSPALGRDLFFLGGWGSRTCAAGRRAGAPAGRYRGAGDSGRDGLRGGELRPSRRGRAAPSGRTGPTGAAQGDGPLERHAPATTQDKATMVLLSNCRR